MDFVQFSWVDYTLFGVMFGLSGAVGIYFGCCGKQQQTTEDYLLGGKKMKVFPVSMSLVASTLSGITLLGLPAEVYMHGTQYSMMAFSVLLMGLVNNYVFLPVFYNLQLTSAYDYLELRFDKRIKSISSVLYTFSNLLFMPVVIYAPSLAFNQVTGFDLHIIAPVMSAICIFYTTIGGLKAVVWTDTLQFSVTLCTLACVLVMGTISVGGLKVVWEKSLEGNRIEFFKQIKMYPGLGITHGCFFYSMNPDPTVRSTFWSIVLGNLFVWVSFLGVGPSAVQRFMAVPTLRDARIALAVFVFFTIVTKLISCFSGLIMYAKYYDCDPLSSGFMKRADQILPFYVLEVATSLPGLSGLFVAGLFSTALSTLSTYLNTLSGIFYSDFIAPFMPRNTSDKKASFIMKIITALLGLLSVCLIFVVEKLGSILELMLSLNGIASGPVLGLFILGMLCPFGNRKGALAGVLSSLLLMFLIVIKNQVHVWNGVIKHLPKPLSVAGCNVTTTMAGVVLNVTSTTLPPSDCPTEEPFWLYRISFHYYFLIGTLVTVIIGLSVSWFTRSSKDVPVNIDLLSPCIHGFLSKSAATTRYESVEKELNIYETSKKDDTGKSQDS